MIFYLVFGSEMVVLRHFVVNDKLKWLIDVTLVFVSERINVIYWFIPMQQVVVAFLAKHKNS